MDKNKEVKCEKAVKEIMRICSVLKIKVDAKEATKASKFLSAWHKAQW